MPFDEDRKERAVLVVSELTTNAIVHAGGVLYLQFSHGDGYSTSKWRTPRRRFPARSRST